MGRYYFVRFRWGQRERQSRLRIVRAWPSPAHPVGFQAARDFSAPFRFGGVCGLVGFYGRGYTHRNRFEVFVTFDERCVTEIAVAGGIEQ